MTLGEVIREAAADADFIAAAQTTLDRATPEGGIWKLLAAAKLANLLAVSKLIDAKIADAREDLNPLLAQIAVVDGAADDLLVQGKNLIWNAFGRPGDDPLFDLLFPGGLGY